MSNTKSDAEGGIPTAEETTPSSTHDTSLSKHGPLLALLALVFALGIVGTAVGSVALSKANDVDSDLDQLSDEVICNGEPTLVQGFTFPPIFMQAPTMVYVPAWDYMDPSWFGIAGNRILYHMDPMYAEDDSTFSDPIGFLSGEETIIKTLPACEPNATCAPPVLHSYSTLQFNDKQGHVVYGGIMESSGVANKVPILGGTGDWKDFSGFLEGRFDPDAFQFSAKIYQSCQ